jgi:hypothetical protein
MVTQGGLRGRGGTCRSGAPETSFRRARAPQAKIGRPRVCRVSEVLICEYSGAPGEDGWSFSSS